MQDKLYTVTREDLGDGYKAVQSTHAAINFIFEHHNKAGPWFKDSNYLCQLVVPTESDLKLLIRKCRQHNIAFTVFREPDIKNQITAIALEPSEKSKRLVKKLPLLFKSKTKQNVTD